MNDEIDEIIWEWIHDIEKDKRLKVHYGSGEFEWDHLRDFYIWIMRRK